MEVRQFTRTILSLEEFKQRYPKGSFHSFGLPGLRWQSSPFPKDVEAVVYVVPNQVGDQPSPVLEVRLMVPEFDDAEDEYLYVFGASWNTEEFADTENADVAIREAQTAAECHARGETQPDPEQHS